MEKLFCQSCGMPLINPSDIGTNEDSSPNNDFCNHCFLNGHFTRDCTMEEMIQSNLLYLHEFNKSSGTNFNREDAAREMRNHFPTLKRWKKEETDDMHRQAINRVVDYINGKLYEPINIQELAQTAHISTFHFHRLFKAIIGESVGSYIQRIRLENIAHKLIHAPESISEIAVQTNYGSMNALSKAFKKHFGAAPSVYRKNPELYTPGKAISGYSPIPLQPSIQKMKDFEMVYLSVTQANRTRSGFIEIWKQLKAFVQEHRLDTAGNYLSLSFDDYMITESEKCRYHIGHMVDVPIKPVGKYGVMKVDGGLFAVFRHCGAYSQLENVYANIYRNWLQGSGYVLRNSHSFEVYIKTPDDVPSEELVTDIYIPIQ